MPAVDPTPQPDAFQDGGQTQIAADDERDLEELWGVEGVSQTLPGSSLNSNRSIISSTAANRERSAAVLRRDGTRSDGAQLAIGDADVAGHPRVLVPLMARTGPPRHTQDQELEHTRLELGQVRRAPR